MHYAFQNEKSDSPLIEASSTDGEIADARLRSARAPGILVAEDEKAVFKMLEVAFMRDGWRVYMAKNGAEAVEVFRQHQDRIDVVLMDVQMPVMNGPRALDEIRAMQRDMPCLIMTGNRHALAGHDRASLGVVEILDKPFDIRKLMNLALEVARSATC